MWLDVPWRQLATILTAMVRNPRVQNCEDCWDWEDGTFVCLSCAPGYSSTADWEACVDCLTFDEHCTDCSDERCTECR